MTTACPACVGAAPAVERAVRESSAPSITLSVPGLHCAACMRTVENALDTIDGVENARVNLTLKRVVAQSNLPPDALARRLAEVGYQAFLYNAAEVTSDADATARDLVLRLGVSGFAMMNVMLLSVAVWSGATDATRDLFHLISAGIAVPAVAYSAQPFFKHAFSALRVGRLNMDVPISLAIVLAAGMSLYEALQGGHHAYFDAALALTFFLLIGRVLEQRTRASAKSAAQELSALEVQTAERMRGGRTETIPVSQLVIGDTVMVATGARIPADGTLLGETAITDRSFLTGESDPVTVAKGASLRAGEINLGAPFTLRAEAVGDDTSLRQMARLVETAENARNTYTSLADKAAQIYAPMVHILAAMVFAGWYFATGDLRLALNVAIAVLIITCPCALGLAVPAVSTAAIGKLYKLGFLVKSATALERLAETEEIVFDKTGTLTKPGFAADIDRLSDDHKSVALGLAQMSLHPVSQALAVHLIGVSPAPISDVVEVSGKGVEGHFDGVPAQLGHAGWVVGTGNGVALRVGEDVVHLTQTERLREGAEDAVRGLKSQGFDLRLLSGDGISRTTRIAEALGISRFWGDLSPEEKHQQVLAETEGDHRVCMIGDGLNDTAALAAAHASVAPSSALDASRNAADVVLMRDGLSDLPTLFATARKAVTLSQQNFMIATAYNAIAIPVAVLGYATPFLAAISMSISSLTVLLNALRVKL
ncbi:MAG: heavy metal translocating P-type ATPase [Pseudomonadota bacterium]